MRKFHVYIIESPSAVDLYHKRFEAESLTHTLTLSGISSSYRLTVNQEAFQAAFYIGIKDYFNKSLLPPIIHISAHGGEDGIQLTDGFLVDWDSLKKLLLPINTVLGGILLLCLSSCKGLSGCRMSMKDDKYPFGAIIANSGEPLWSETNIGYASFYHLFAKGFELKDAVKAMRVASGNNDFQIITSGLARRAYIEVLKKQVVFEKLKQSIPTGQDQSLSKSLT